ncbi:hypothetical protein HQ590_08060 [bacterium]|nr:hypothetical protein [bacterium]
MLLLVGLMLLLWSAGLASARTLTLTDREATGGASINAHNPRAGWAGWEHGAGWFQDEPLAVTSEAAVLFRWSLAQIPPGQRIINAELSLPTNCPYPNQRIYVWRLLQDWGLGVCHLFRQVRPQKLEWAKPGARGLGVDRAVQPSRVVPLEVGGRDIRVDVTRDVQLWYGGLAKNHGWLVTGEDENQWVQMYSPFYQGVGRWRLRVTYEPK